jgi:hypothetical protein
MILTIYDLDGRDVATLVDALKSAGEYSATWNAEKLASGCIFTNSLLIGLGRQIRCCSFVSVISYHHNTWRSVCCFVDVLPY